MLLRRDSHTGLLLSKSKLRGLFLLLLFLFRGRLLLLRLEKIKAIRGSISLHLV
jgi:hypothetical protein